MSYKKHDLVIIRDANEQRRAGCRCGWASLIGFDKEPGYFNLILTQWQYHVLSSNKINGEEAKS